MGLYVAIYVAVFGINKTAAPSRAEMRGTGQLFYVDFMQVSLTFSVIGADAELKESFL